MKISRLVYLWTLILLAAALTGCAAIPPLSTGQVVTPPVPTTPAPAITILPVASLTPTASLTRPPAVTPSHTPLPSPAPPPTRTPPAVVIFPKGPDVIFSGDNTQMKLVWQLSAAEDSTLQWGLDTQYSLGSVTTAESTPDHLHTFTITGLTPGTKYVYRVLSSEGASAGSFYAAPDQSAAALKFFAYGDSREGSDILDQINALIVKIYSADPAFQTFIVDTGDLISDGDQETYWADQFFDPKMTNTRMVLANLAFLPVMGNHENAGVLFKKYFPMPFVAGRYWSFDYGPAHVVMLDEYRPYAAGSAQYTWLANDLASSSKPWKFIVLHEPGWSAAGGHLNDPTVQKDIQPLAQKYGVSIVFGAHNHYYARAVVNGVTHLTVGGGGAPLYPPVPGQPYVVKTQRSYCFVEISIDGSTLTGTALQPDGSFIESFTITR